MCLVEEFLWRFRCGYPTSWHFGIHEAETRRKSIRERWALTVYPSNSGVAMATASAPNCNQLLSAYSQQLIGVSTQLPEARRVGLWHVNKPTKRPDCFMYVTHTGFSFSRGSLVAVRLNKYICFHTINANKIRLL